MGENIPLQLLHHDNHDEHDDGRFERYSYPSNQYCQESGDESAHNRDEATHEGDNGEWPRKRNFKNDHADANTNGINRRHNALCTDKATQGSPAA